MDSTDKAWRDYRLTKSKEIKEQLILTYAPLVKYVASRVLAHIGQHVEYEELISYGIFGLIDAIDKFDIDKGVKFETYASLRIRGAIIDNIRKMDWVPRTLRQKNKQYESVYNKLEDELGREPTEVEMADQLGMTVPEIQELEKKSSVFSLISLDEYLEQNHESSFSGIIDTETDTPEAYIDKQELHGMLTEAIEKLSEKEQKVIILYYFEELTLKEISAIMNVSESRISQIHSKAVGKLHVKLGKFRQILYV